MTTNVESYHDALKGKRSSELFYYKIFKSIPVNKDQHPHRFLLFLLYGFGEHASRYESFANDLVRAFSEHNVALDIVAPDFPGHGKSSGSRGHIESFDDISSDLVDLVRHITKEHDYDDQNILLFGKGVGALYALQMIHQYSDQDDFNPRACILLNPAFKMKWNLPRFLENLDMSSLGSMNKLRLPFRLDDTLVSTIGVDKVAFDEDPLVCHHLTLGAFTEIQKASRPLRISSYYIDIPLFIGLSDDADSLFDQQVSELFAQGLSFGQIYHYSTMVNDNDQVSNHMTERMIEDIVNWYQSLA